MLALLLVAGCSFGESEFQTIKNSCANDASCPQGVCDGNICIDPGLRWPRTPLHPKIFPGFIMNRFISLIVARKKILVP